MIFFNISGFSAKMQGVQTRRSSKRQSSIGQSEVNSSKGARNSSDLPSALQSTSSSSKLKLQSKGAVRQNNQEVNVDDAVESEINLYSLYPTKTAESPILEAERTILVDGAANPFQTSPAFNDEEIKQEMAQKDDPYVVKQLQNVVRIPLVYYSIREYVVSTLSGDYLNIGRLI